MSLRFIYGRAGSGKTRYCLEEIKSKIADGMTRPLVLLVPEQYTYQAERDLITVLQTGGILKTEVLSFRRLAFRVFNETGGLTYPHIHPAGKSMIICRILDRMGDGLKTYAGLSEHRGFINSLSSLITEMKKYDITPDRLESAASVIEEGLPLRDKLRELKDIYAEYEKMMAERYRDSDDDLTLAARKLGQAKSYDGAEIWIDGFSGFTPQEYNIIGCLLKKAERVSITLCTDSLDGKEDSEGTDVFYPVKRVYKKAVRIAEECGVPVEPPVVLKEEPPYRFKGSAELSHLERNLEAYPYKTFREKTKDISLFSSVNAFSEVEAAASDIIRLCRDKGLRYRDIAVLVSNLEAYEGLIEAVFEEYGIPCFIDRKIDIIKHPLVRMLLSMLDIFNDNWSYEAVFGYLKTGLTGIETSRIDRLENYVLACGIRGNSWTNGQDWDMNPGPISDEGEAEDPGDLLKEINETRYEVVRPLLEFRRKTKGRKKAAEICAALYDFLCDTGVPERIENIVDMFRENGQLSLANEYSQVWNIIMEVFDQAVEVMGDETFGIERFSKILNIGFGEYKLGLIPPSLDQVLVGSADRSRSHEIKAMYILGANDGMFPAPMVSEGILTDYDRQSLNKLGVELAADTRSKAFEERFMVYRALTTAGGYLRVSWPIADNEGRSMRPSIIVSRLRKLFPAITETSDIEKQAADETEMVTSRNPAFIRMTAALRRKADGRDIAPVWSDVYRWFNKQKDWNNKCRSIRQAYLYTNNAEPVGRDKIRALYGEQVYSSVSRLEKYTACPFAYYVQYGLGAKERRVYGLSAPDVGTFLHKAIEKFSRCVSDCGISWREIDRKFCEEKASQIVDEMLENMKAAGFAASKRYTVLLTRLKRVVARAAWMIAEHIRCSSFNPVGFELEFGEGGEFPPVIIELDSGERVKLVGKIDRVDALETPEGTYLRIIDYKSGNKDFKLSDVFYGLQIQLITYMDALWNQDDGPGRFPGGILYFHQDDPVIKAAGRMTDEQLEQALKKTFRMKGLLLADVKLIREMDNTIDGTSMIIPARINKGDVLGRSSAASLEQFRMLRKYVQRLLKGICEEIMKGQVPIRPYRKRGITSCKYCSYSPVCQFDAAMKGNSFRMLYDREDDEVWKLIGQGGETCE